MSLLLPSISLDENGNLEIGSGFEINANFSEIKNKVNPLFVSIDTLQNNWSDLFEVKSEFTLTFPASNSLPSGGTSGPYLTGTYLKSTAIQPFTIDLVEDSDLFVKMTTYERSFIDSLISSDISSFKLKVENGGIINETTKLVSGKMISLTQLYVEDEIQIKIDTAIPSEYFKTSYFSVIPSKPDPSNMYRYKVSNSAYTKGTLRVYVNTHRVPDNIIDQNSSNIGEFYFINTLPLSELPISKDDIIYCDYESPIVLSPSRVSSEDISLAKWWGDIYTSSDGSSVSTTAELQPLRFYVLSGDYSASSGYSASEDAFRIISTNPYSDITGSVDNGMKTVFFVLDTNKISQNSWYTLIGTDTSTIIPSSSQSNLTFTSSNSSVDVVVSGTTIDLVAAPSQNSWYTLTGTDASTIDPTSTQTGLTFDSSDASVNVVVSGTTIDITAVGGGGGSSYFEEVSSVLRPVTSTNDIAIYQDQKIIFNAGTNNCYITFNSTDSTFDFYIAGTKVATIGA